MENIFLGKVGVAQGCENLPPRSIWDPNIGKCHKVCKLLYLNKLLAVFGGLGSRTFFSPLDGNVERYRQAGWVEAGLPQNEA